MLPVHAAGPEIRRILWTANIITLQESTSCAIHGSDKFSPNRTICFSTVPLNNTLTFPSLQVRVSLLLCSATSPIPFVLFDKVTHEYVVRNTVIQP